MGKTVLFGRYRLEEPLGAGGSAQVWRATDKRTGDTVAVKRLHPLVFAGEAGRERLLREFRALRDLDEPHIVRVRDLELTDDDGALILDYVAGPTLAARLADDERLSTAEAISITLDIASALAAAHAAGIIHRDVTPANILLDPDDGARLTDFGIALGGTDATRAPALTATGQLVGTLRYLAPEQLRGAPATAASDVHALAAVAYEMLAGQPAYPAASPVDLVEAQSRGIAPIPAVTPALDAAVRRGLSQDPADRPADGAAFAAEIEDALGSDRTQPMAIPVVADMTSSMPVPAPPAASPAPAAQSLEGPLWGPVGIDAPAEVPAGARDLPPHPIRRTSLRVPAAALAVALLVVGVVFAAGREPSAPPAARPTAPIADPAVAPSVTPAPTPQPEGDEGGDNDNGGNGKGKGKGGGNGKGND